MTSLASGYLGQLAAIIRGAPESQMKELTGLRKTMHDLIRDSIAPETRRLEAERDGWQKLAKTLIEIAIGGDISETDIPPLELLELRAVGKDTVWKPALAQFWADLTAKETERRMRRRVLVHAVTLERLIELMKAARQRRREFTGPAWQRLREASDALDGFPTEPKALGEVFFSPDPDEEGDR